MDCQLFERQMQLNIDGRLSPAEREDMLRHANSCPSCAALLQEMMALEDLLHQRLNPAEAPAGFAVAVMAALPPLAQQPAKGKVVRPLWQRWGTVAAAAALLLGVGLAGLWPGLFGADPSGGPLEPKPIVAENPPARPTTQPSNQVGMLPNQDTNTKPASPNPLQQKDPDGLGGVTVPPEQYPDNPPPPSVEAPGSGQVIAPEPDPEPFVSSIDLPIPAGVYEETPSAQVLVPLLLAVYDDCDAVLPRQNEEGLVEFFIRYRGQNQLWRQSLNVETAPEYVEAVKTLPSLAEITGSVDNSASFGFAYVSALSPDARLLAVNQGGEQAGLRLYENNRPAAAEADNATEAPLDEEADLLLQIKGAIGGGKVLSWSPDGNKLLYTDANGALYVYYRAEQLPLSLYNGLVSCASWTEDGSTVIFAGKMTRNEHSAIYAIVVP